MNMEQMSTLCLKPQILLLGESLPLHNSCSIILFNGLNTVVS